MRVALAEDDADIAAFIETAIEQADISCDTFIDGRALQTGLKRATYDAVLADWNMPPPTGIEVVRWAQEALESPPPFIMMTSRSDPDDIVAALEAGACDYIVKPENPAVIIARLKAAARRGNAGEKDREVRHGPYRFDRLEQSASLEGEPIKLTAKEFALAMIFFENRDRPLSRGYLLGEVWGSSDQVETRTLDMHVSRIRNKLSLRPENGYVIQSVFGFGYRLDGFEGDTEA